MARDRLGHLCTHYRWVAELVRNGKRETPQRFRPLAYRLAREPADRIRIWKLYGWIIRYLLAEFREDQSRPRHLETLAERMRILLDVEFDPVEASALQREVLGLAPHRYRRRGYRYQAVTADRVLLVLRMMSVNVSGIGTGESWVDGDDVGLAWCIESTLAYYVADYDRDHLVMTGPAVAVAVAERLELIALWCQFNMIGFRS